MSIFTPDENTVTVIRHHKPLLKRIKLNNDFIRISCIAIPADVFVVERGSIINIP